MESAYICMLCHGQSATVFCCCAHPLPYLCNNCANYHLQKPGALHTIRPLAEVIGIQSSRDLYMISLRLVNIKSGEEALRENIGRLDACANEIEGKFAELIRRITETKEEKLALLQQIKTKISEEIDAVIVDAMNHLIEIPGKPDFQTDLARKVYNFTPDIQNDFLLFDYSVSDPDPRLEQLIKVFLRPMNIQVKTTLPEKPTLTFLSQKVLHKFDVKSETWSSLSLVGTDLPNLQVEWDTVSALYDDGIGLLCCGGGSPSTSTASRIDITTGEVTLLRNMSVRRSGHGLVQFKGVFYVFGGYGSKKSSEKFENQVWELNPTEMNHPHQWFTACVHNDLIFLVGGGSKYIETFDPVQRVFAIWGHELPEPLADASLSSVFHESDLLVLSANNLGRWSDIQQQFTVEKYPKVLRSAWSCMTPIHDGVSSIYLASQELGLVRKFDFNTRRYVEFKTPVPTSS